MCYISLCLKSDYRSETFVYVDRITNCVKKCMVYIVNYVCWWLFCFLMKSSFLLFGVTMRDLVDFVLEIVSVKRLTVSAVMNSWRSRCWWTKWWWHHTWGPRKTLHSCRRKSATGLFKLKAHFAGNHTLQAFRMHTASCLSKHRTVLKLRFCVSVVGFFNWWN